MFHLLIVEDEKRTREGLCRHIDWNGIGVDPVTAVAGGMEALLAVDDIKPAILLSDIRTPDDASRVVAVELPEGTIRDKLNLVDNEAIYRKKIVVRGNIRQYLGQPGLVDVTQYVKK